MKTKQITKFLRDATYLKQSLDDRIKRAEVKLKILKSNLNNTNERIELYGELISIAKNHDSKKGGT